MILSSWNHAFFRNPSGRPRRSPSTFPMWASGRYYPSKYLNFDGTDDRVDLPSTNTIFGASQDVTVEMWIDPWATTDFLRIFCQKASASNDFMICQVNSNITLFTNGAVNRCIGAKYTTTGGWFHLAVTRSGSTHNVFKNGLLTTAASGSTAGASNRNTIGCRYTTSYRNFFNGRLWNLRVWNRALSQAEIGRWMNMDPKPNRSDLLMWLPMNEAAGTTLSDVTGNGWNGTITGCTWV